jgi:S1-C subfamily serine protease
VVEIRSDNRHWSGLGTYVGDGLIVTKASELRFGRDLSVVLNDGLVAGATVAATDPTLDLALVQLWAPKFADGITPICWAEAKHLLVGTIVTVVTPPAFSEPKGIVCVPSRAIPRLPGIVPVQVKDAEGGVEITATFVEITDSLWLASPPFNLRRGDVITNVGGVTVANRAAFAKLVFNEARIGRHPRAAGELVTVTYRRQGKEEVAFVHLRHAHSVPTQRIHPSSYRYSSFPAAIASDLNARPEHCGAPVVDAEGRVVGLLIAQAPFIESLILPSTEVSAAVKAMRRSVTKKK